MKLRTRPSVVEMRLACGDKFCSGHEALHVGPASKITVVVEHQRNHAECTCEDAFNTFFSETGAGKHVPRCVMVDSSSADF